MDDSISMPTGDIGFSIGIGSIFFSVPSEPELSGKDYYEKIRKTLQKIENISNIEISNYDSKFGSYISYNDDDITYVQHIYDVELSFDIFVSKDKQSELGFWCGDESVSFLLRNEYYYPVCYLSSSKRNEKFQPSTAVAMVREYLREKLQSTDVNLCCVGPSPFHAEFILFESPDPKIDLQDVSEGFGYKTYVSETKNLDEAIIGFSEKYGTSISLFYQLHNLRSKCIDLQKLILYGTEETIKKIRSGSKLSKIREIMKSSSSVDDINMSSLEDTMSRAEMSSLINENFNESSNQDPCNELEFHFRDLVRFSSDTSHMAAMDVIRNVEARRQSFFQNASVLVAGLMGGVLGAILGSTITVILSK